MNYKKQLRLLITNILLSTTFHLHTMAPLTSYANQLYTLCTSKIIGSLYRSNTHLFNTFQQVNHKPAVASPVKQNIYHIVQDRALETTFRYLTKEPRSKIMLFETEEDQASTAFIDESNNGIYINPKNFALMPPSQKIRIVLHEFRHYQQLSQFSQEDLQKILQEKNNGPYDPVIPPTLQKLYAPEVIQAATNYLTPSRLLFNPFWLHQEHDADHFAVQQIQCPICLKIIQAKTTPWHFTKTSIGDNKHMLGYFGFDDYIHYIQMIEHNNRCPAHTKRADDQDQHNQIITDLEAALDQMHELLNFPEFQNYIQEIKNKNKGEPIETDRSIIEKIIAEKHKNFPKQELLYQKLYDTICDLDHRSGSLLLHLANFGKDIIHSEQHDQQLWNTILENEKKRREIKLLPESCNSKKN